MALVHKYMADQSHRELSKNLEGRERELGQDRMQTDKSSQHDRLKDGKGCQWMLGELLAVSSSREGSKDTRINPEWKIDIGDNDREWKKKMMEG